MLSHPDLIPADGSTEPVLAARILDLLRSDDLLDSDIDAVIDAHLANPGERFYVLQSLYRVDFDAITGSMRRSTTSSPGAIDHDHRQALTCALLMHRPQILRPRETNASPKDRSGTGEVPQVHARMRGNQHAPNGLTGRANVPRAGLPTRDAVPAIGPPNAQGEAR